MHNPDELAVELYQVLMNRPFAIPDDLREELVNACAPTNHAHIAVVQAVEAVYCCADDAPVELLQWAADAADCAASYNLGGLATSGRGVGISNALRGRPGVSQRDPAPATPPAPIPLSGSTPVEPAPTPEEPEDDGA